MGCRPRPSPKISLSTSIAAGEMGETTGARSCRALPQHRLELLVHFGGRKSVTLAYRKQSVKAKRPPDSTLPATPAFSRSLSKASRVRNVSMPRPSYLSFSDGCVAVGRRTIRSENGVGVLHGTSFSIFLNDLRGVAIKDISLTLHGSSFFGVTTFTSFFGVFASTTFVGPLVRSTRDSLPPHRDAFRSRSYHQL